MKVDEMTEALKKRLDRTVTLLNTQLPEQRSGGASGE
jgi:hypothetical protein